MSFADCDQRYVEVFTVDGGLLFTTTTDLCIRVEDLQTKAYEASGRRCKFLLEGQELHAAGLLSEALADACDPVVLLAVFPDLLHLRESGCTAAELRRAGHTLSELQGAGYTAGELRLAAYTAKDLSNARYPAWELRRGGYSAGELAGVGCPLTELHRIGYSASEVKMAGYSASELRNAGYSVRALKDAGYNTYDAEGGCHLQ
mmetsp:Transcript_85577/g.238923  ORF Transcript_85577/g.238923 Transcript_85577/m.238923 type:complete len:203 (-) Transcript_85577:303-911(-)|eukprot:CAMPEP_0117536600 /NCGR_PEP_ID=MMETSP0784-20121206/41536_1 /TAXON_ID=39447 /ORGANISM="" /LENGTH=202 /DNA_ID=CAMNT_0005333167 /DNA_START=95 /DNA_END=703 /DNA_ORIENTATION=-